jgi:2-C-methyl-D-erythritol 4-phosphate cytidylyltransferase
MTATLTPAQSPPRFFALIPCAGTGSRAGAVGPKQYQVVAGQPLVMHTVAAFQAVTRIAGVVIAVSDGDDFWHTPLSGVTVVPCGGATRAATVGNGLAAMTAQGVLAHDWVLVHDAARCLVTPGQINALIDACQHDAVGGLLAHKLADTLKRESGGRVEATLERADKWLAQTPQMFRMAALTQALGAVGDNVTDEASAIESTGARPLLVPGGAQNIKVTYPDDFALAEAILRSRTP